ncbi:MAG: hypothetical protein IPO08_15365 [Xanthomonadales bacterium]|nr:hypothetical protein [Xanthomonadales bacterium]
MRLHFEMGLSQRLIARSWGGALHRGAGVGAVCGSGAELATDPALSDEVLEHRLYGRPAGSGKVKSCERPVWAEVVWPSWHAKA